MYDIQTANHHVHQVSGGVGPLVTAVTLVSLAVSVLVIAGMWGVSSKAGQPGWAAIIPFYSTIVLLRVVGKPWWWLLLMFIPVVNIVVGVIVCVDLAKSFGKGAGFGILTFLFSIVCIPTLGFGSAQYVGPGGQPSYPGQPYPPPYVPQGQQYSHESSTAQFPPR